MNRAKLAAEIAQFATDPHGHALFAYPWGEPDKPLATIAGPRRWQTEVLREIADHLGNPETRFTPLRIAVASGHGAGKSSLIAMIAKWALDTCADCRVVVTANTENQLVTKTSPELTKWQRLAITRDWFRPSVMSITSAEAGHAHSWRLDCIPWSIHQPEAFAGLHNRGRRIVLIFDEASSIADKIWEVAEGALTDEDTEIIWLAVGNPTRNGRFKDCFGKHRHLWSTRHIDSRTVEGTNKAYLDELVSTYGEESDIVKVRVRGQFPSASSMQFIGSELARAAIERKPDEASLLPSDVVVMGLDHARFGDDSSVLAIRKGRDAKSRPWKVWNGANSMEIAGDVATLVARYDAQAIFVDAGGTNAGGVIDRLRQLVGNRSAVFEVNFGGKGRGEASWGGEVRARTANKRAEMYTNLRAWLERGCIPDEARLEQDLTAIEYSYNADNAILLERKEHLRSRGFPSTDWSDALALTFAEEVLPRRLGAIEPWMLPGGVTDYDRYDELR